MSLVITDVDILDLRAFIRTHHRNTRRDIEKAFQTCGNLITRLLHIATPTATQSKILRDLEALYPDLKDDSTEYGKRMVDIEDLVLDLEKIFKKPANGDKKNPKYSKKQEADWTKLVKRGKAMRNGFSRFELAAIQRRGVLQTLVKQAKKAGTKP